MIKHLKTLFLCDCIKSHLEKHFAREDGPNENFIQIQGGGGFVIDKLELSMYERFILSNAWANGASVIDDTEIWEDRVGKQIYILEKIASTNRPFLIIDRPGVLDRYIDRDFRLQIDHDPKELGMCPKKAAEAGWRPQDKEGQKARRKKYFSKIKRIIELDHVYYFDMQSLMLGKEITRLSSEVSHKGGVIDEAPWHFKPEYNNIIIKICEKFIDNEKISKEDGLNIINEKVPLL